MCVTFSQFAEEEARVVKDQALYFPAGRAGVQILDDSIDDALYHTE